MSTQATLQVGDRVRLLRDDRPGVMAPEPLYVGRVGIVTGVHYCHRSVAPYYSIRLDERLTDVCDRECLEVVC